jgi:replicative DNA helicase
MAALPDVQRAIDLHQKVSYLPDIHRLLPQAPDAERGVLSSFLLSPRFVGDLCVEKDITKEHFHYPAHATVYGVMIEFYRENEPLDGIILTQHLRDAGNLDTVGGAHFITELFNHLPTAANAGHYLEIIQEKYDLRELIKVCTEYAARAYDEQGDPQSLLSKAQAATMGLSKATKKKRRPFKELIMDAIRNIESGDDAIADILSGLTDLDRVVKMRRGNMIVIGGTAKSGKTTLAGTIAVNAAIHQKKRVVLVSLEMTDMEMIKRMLAAAGRVNVSKLTNESPDADLAKLITGASRLGECDVEIVSDVYELAAIVTECRKMQIERPIDLIVIDYIQLVDWSTGRREETREQIVGAISNKCKKLAGELNCVLVGLSQLNEGGKLRDSRAIGMDANAILSVDEDAELGRKIRVVAQRSGESNVDINAVWLPKYTLFANPEEYEQPELVHMANGKKSRK